MIDRTETVHVHRGDVATVTKEYRQKGFELKERTAPTIITQRGFVRLVFAPTQDQEASSQAESPQEQQP